MKHFYTTLLYTGAFSVLCFVTGLVTGWLFPPRR